MLNPVVAHLFHIFWHEFRNLNNLLLYHYLWNVSFNGLHDRYLHSLHDGVNWLVCSDSDLRSKKQHAKAPLERVPLSGMSFFTDVPLLWGGVVADT